MILFTNSLFVYFKCWWKIMEFLGNRPNKIDVYFNRDQIVQNKRNCQLWIESLQQARNVFNFVNFWSFSIILYSTILRQFYRQLCFSIWTLITSIMYTVTIGSSAKWGSRQIWSIGAAKTWKRKVWKWQGCQKKTVVKKYQQAFHNTNTFVAINDCSRIYFRIEDISEIVCSSNLSLRCFRFFWRTKKGLVSSNSGVGCWRLIAGRKFELYFGASFESLLYLVLGQHHLYL